MEMTAEQKKLIENNIALAGSVARRYLYLFKNSTSYDYDDVFQIASIGLCKAAATYAADAKVCFSSYAYACMRNEILDTVKYENNAGHLSNNAAPIDDVRERTSIFKLSVDPQDVYESHELYEILQSMLPNVSRPVRVGIEALIAMSNQTLLKDFASENGYNLPYVKQAIFVAKKYLRENKKIARFLELECG